jgi:hypothetical protein
MGICRCSFLSLGRSRGLRPLNQALQNWTLVPGSSYCPVDPNPAAPRGASSSVSVSSNVA